MPFSQHPFFKLPILELPEGVTVRKFNAKKAFMQRNFRNSPTVALEHMRNAFAKETLTASEADMLVLKTQRLVAHLFYQHRKQEEGLTPSDVVYVLGRRYLFLDAVVWHLFYQHRKQEDGLTPSDVVYVLGRRYLFLDAVVCAIQLLEPAMEASSWWEKLTSVLPSELDLADRPFPSSRSNFYIGFAKRLTAAIELLKTRVRPEPQETVSLKRELLCKKTTHPQFLLERWNDWRKQDRDAGGYQEDYEDYLSD
ncbi:uncharacterized protein EMH_0071700 [Eimeria mitis]|uniref:Uncharacterized protein n=1 Tax=Eimeria mitis TaxID=44415 RepID=U6K4X1_9EIME|nr:uncharacterized protein EMH_0071700 [Eimeria mitis]CDJ32021.1 hypothetical protein, conserved [Eimeria mitis]